MVTPVIQSNVSLTAFNTFGIAARAHSYVEIHTVDQLRDVLSSSDAQEKILILGGGSNLLLTQDFPGLVLHNKLYGKKIIEQDANATYVEAAAGENWHDFVRWTLDKNLAGLENLSLIPGTVGAAPIQNIGAYGVEMKDTFQSLQALDISDNFVRQFNLEHCKFSYRDSVFKRELKGRYVIVSVTFRLPRTTALLLDYGDLRAELQRMNCAAPNAQTVSEAVCNIRRRKLPDPAVIGNAGSFFQNPIVLPKFLADLELTHGKIPHFPAPNGTVKLAAAWLIEQCGWKGKTLGRAGVHEHHALVLVNRGGATGLEILNLAHAIQDSVLEKFGIKLQPEPVIVSQA